MDSWDKKFRRNLNDVKRGIRNLRKMNLKIEVQETETMIATTTNHVYVVDYMPSGRVCLQKHLFSFEPHEYHKCR